MMRASRGPALPLPPPSRCPAGLAIYSRWWRERVIKIIDADGRHCSASSPLRMPSYTPRYTPRSTLPSPVPRTFLHAYFMPPGNYRFLLLLLGPRRHSPLSLSVVNVLYVLSYSTAFNHAACGFFSTFHLIFFFFSFFNNSWRNFYSTRHPRSIRESIVRVLYDARYRLSIRASSLFFES